MTKQQQLQDARENLETLKRFLRNGAAVHGAEYRAEQLVRRLEADIAHEAY